MAKRPPFFPFYPKDFAADHAVEAMDTEAIGAYILLLCKAWGETPIGTLPDDDRLLARWARLTPERWSEVRPQVVAAFTPCADSRLSQKRMRKEAEAYQAKCRKASESAKKRWQSDGNANAQPTHCEGNARASGSDSGSLDSSGGGMQGGGVDPDEWPGNRVYHVADAYRPTGRVGGSEGSQAAIRDALTRIHGRMCGKPDDAIEWLIGRCRAFASSPAGKLGRFTPLLKNWMADGCYDQDDAEWQAGGEPGQETETQRKARVAAMVQEASK